MSMKSDRSLGLRRPIAVIALTVAVIAAAILVFFNFHKKTVVGTIQAPLRSEAILSRPDDSLGVMLFLPVDGMLEGIAGTIAKQPDAQLEAREAAAAVLSSEHAGRAPILQALRLKALYLDSTGTAYVSLAFQDGRKNIAGAAWDELLAVYSIVNTVMQVVPEVRVVRFLVDGKEAQSLAGHLDLTQSFVKRMDLVRQH